MVNIDATALICDHGLMAVPDKQTTDAWIALMRAQQLAYRRAERALRKAQLPPYGWYDALWELEKAGDGGLRIHQLERQMLIAQSNVSRLIDRLQEAKCVTRRPCPEDGRGQRIVITAEGKAVRAKMWPVYAAVIQSVIGERISTDEASALAAILRTVIEHEFAASAPNPA